MKIIFSDIDGTLLNHDHLVTRETQQAIRACAAKNIYFVPVSARMPEAIQPIMDSIGITSPLIAYNGALIQAQDGSVIDSKTMPADKVFEICQLIEKEDKSLAWNIYSYQNWFSSHQAHNLVRNEELVVGLESQTRSLAELSSLNEAHKVLIMCPPEKTEQVLNKLKEQFPELSIARSLPHLIEIMATGIDKGQAVTTLATYYDVPMAQTMAFGDNYNDLEMLETVGQGVVMGNAPEPLKECIGKVTLDHNHDGIARVLEEEIL
ncbi:Cof-type HAD-IIB family hydrolase [Streptococcus dentapri]|uniref:Cof-type HAD-IIB family hydrolase n=1 Tax=Streptococcus dentapri TaxID=573564 RepID=A0ABV8D055_9STRE